MRSGTIAFLGGVLGLQLFSSLPTPLWTYLLLPALVALRWRPARLPAAFAAGFLWALLQAHWLLSHDWPTACVGKDVVATGTVLSIPHRIGRQTRFQFRIEQLRGCASVRLPIRARAGWYSGAPPLAAGERWRLHLRLKDRNGFFNPGGFDYERWLLQQRVGASGYVRHGEEAVRLGQAGDPAALLQRGRQKLYDALDAHLPERPEAALVLALALGERARIGAEQWRVLRATGTSHLVAISGLHIGLVGGFGWILGLWGWKRSAYLCGHVPAQRAAAVVALIFAVVYAALAGFSIPTQRALLMLAIGLAALFGQRQRTPSHAWFLALLAVLILDPLAVLGAGFWLSFSAVAMLLYGMGCRLGRVGLWWRWGRAQWVVALGLLPLTLVVFGSLSVIGPGANVLAVPWVGLVAVPLVLGGVLLLGVAPALAGLSLKLACVSLAAAWTLLTSMAELPFASAMVNPSLLWLPWAMLSVVWLLAPRGFPGRPVALLLLLPLWNPADTAPPEGEVEFTLLDVGQGLAAVIRTHRHALIYDTGPKFGPGFDAGSAVVLPFLRYTGVSHIDTVVLSHGDRDHTGGFDALRANLDIDVVLAGEPEPERGQRPCLAGRRWQWDQVHFEILQPSAASTATGNDRSCVLRVRAGGRELLLTGDLQRAGERALLQAEPDLQADVLIAPHHGSAGSSSPAFVAAVRPRWVLFASGYHNRFGFPRPDVVQRYRELGAETLSSAQCGAIQLRFGARRAPAPRCRRRRRGHYWNRR